MEGDLDKGRMNSELLVESHRLGHGARGKGSEAGLVTVPPFMQEMKPEGRCWPGKRESRDWKWTAELRVNGLNSG